MKSNPSNSNLEKPHKKIKEIIKAKSTNLSKVQKSITKRIWGIISYKWKWQLLLNLPFMLIWLLDKTSPTVHKFDMELIASLPIPIWLQSFLG
tara:strand:+ start:3627 stop:3905 length:279 start_codon:yes stop_codon:yes gene_type:complete